MQLTEIQLWLAAFLASAIVWLLKQYSKTNEKWNPKEGTLSVLVYVASFLVAFFFGSYTFPAFPVFVDVLGFVPLVFNWATEIIAVLSTVAGVAFLVYNVAWKTVLEYLAGRVTAVTAKLIKK